MNAAAKLSGPAIQVSHLGLRLGATCVLDDLSFTVSPGSIHCLVGPNGGGKTSTLRCILGQMPHTGEVHIRWADVRQIGYVPQLIELERTLPLSIMDFMTVATQKSPAFNGTRRSLRPYIEEALREVGLADKRNFMLGSLSGGERQRLLFAQALLPVPSLLVLDEPMTSLDEDGSALFESLIRRVHASGATVLWINHDLAQVARMAQETSIIDGRLVASGATELTLERYREYRGVS